LLFHIRQFVIVAEPRRVYIPPPPPPCAALPDMVQLIRDSEEKITGRSGDYTAESAARKQQIAADIERIKQYIKTK